MHPGHVVIVGASLAGLRTAQALRRRGFTGRLTVVGAEAHLPYDRPPLSKAFLTDDAEPDVSLAAADALGDLDVTFELGSPAVELDAVGRSIALADGERISYDALVLATGSTPRRLPAAEGIGGIHVLRSLEDGRGLRADLAGAKRLVVVGAGFIGCEIASSARTLGVDVTIVEALDQPLVRGLGSELGAVAADWYRARGVTLHLDTGVVGFRSEDVADVDGPSTRRVTGVELSTGDVVDADVVVVGIGVVPATDWLAGSGVVTDNGVVCDEFLAAVGVDDVWAVGDVARWPHPTLGSLRLEHWTAASETADRVATNLLARADDAPLEAHAPIPYVWSDQFGTKIQIAGRIDPTHSIDVVRGSTEATADDNPRFVAIAHRDDEVTGVVGVGEPRRVMLTQMAMEKGPVTVADARDIIG